ncbi:MAG: lipase family protein, partial [Symploca sp. SIO1C2]|nr:lipase family protein [Symploca sp. SIO1C2]
AVQGPNDEVPEIIFTGISLGGALSPVLALAALDSQDTWAHGNSFNIYVEPIAGPTPGNEDFSTYYNQRLEEHTTRIWNSIDIIPHAWNEEMLDEIPSLYEDEIGATDLIQTLVEGAKFWARGGNYTQLMPDTLPLEGTVMQPIPSICGESTSINLSPLTETETTAFLEQAGYQHVLAYADLLDVVEPYCYLIDMGSLPDMKTTSIKLSTLEKLAATNQRQASADKHFCCPTDKISGDKQQCVAFPKPVGTEMLITNETSNVYTKVQVEKSWSEGDQDIVVKTDPQMILPGKSLPVVFDQEKEVITVVMTETSNPSATDLSVQCLTP